MIYFASDFHLGSPGISESRKRELLIVKWLDEIKKDAAEIYLAGDVFDFWFEYRKAVPRGYARLFGKLAELSDKGIIIHWFTGNHDMWIFDYLPAELGVTIYRGPVVREINGKKFYIAHGDGLGPGDHGYKFIKMIFSGRICQWLFRWIHPDLGIRLAEYLSRLGRMGQEKVVFKGVDKEWLYIHACKLLEKGHFDFFIFGHRHVPVEMKIPPPSGTNRAVKESRFFYLGDWITHFSYAVFDGEKVELKRFNI